MKVATSSYLFGRTEAYLGSRYLIQQEMITKSTISTSNQLNFNLACFTEDCYFVVVLDISKSHMAITYWLL